MQFWFTVIKLHYPWLYSFDYIGVGWSLGNKVQKLTYCSLVTTYGDIDLGKYWLAQV